MPPRDLMGRDYHEQGDSREAEKTRERRDYAVEDDTREPLDTRDRPNVDETYLDRQDVDKAVARMLESPEAVDLTKPGAWGRYVHEAIQERVQAIDVDAEVEKSVVRFREDGSEGKGRIDVFHEGSILEIKTHNLDRMSDSELIRFLDSTARQVESYQWSPSIAGKPEASVLIEFSPASQERREFVERFLAGRGIATIWGNL